MPFEPSTVDDLGLRLYSTLPPVISELVSNAYDAESPKVEITIPTGSISKKSEVVIRDYGHGLNSAEVQAEFLPIGRKRRGAKGADSWSRNRKRKITGRKGLGKLAAFGVASEMDVRFISKGEAICLRINYDELKAWPETHGTTAYEPTIVKSRSGKTRDAEGAEIRLRFLRRKKAINAAELRKGLARRLSIIGTKFEVLVNGTGVQPGDRIDKSQCRMNMCWDTKALPGKGKVNSAASVTGWIGFLPSSSQANRGVDIFANGKAAELGSYFGLASTHAQFARAYLVGEIHADFLDDKEDLITTARNSVVWESQLGLALQKWGQTALKWVFAKWLDGQREEKKDKLLRSTDFETWISGRTASEQRVAERMVKILIDDPNIELISAGPLFEIVKSSVETKAFHELVDTIEAKGAHAATLLKLFQEWRIIEAREHLKLADGRLEAIGKLKKFIDRNALEVQQMQPLFEQNPWLINTKWAEADGQTTYTTLLRQHFKEGAKTPASDRRIDILGVTADGALTVVEIKRPGKTLDRHNLQQIEEYVDWARSTFVGTGQHAPKYVHGLLIVGKLSANAAITEKQTRLAGDDIRVETYNDIYQQASEYYNLVEKRLANIAPEYTRTKRKELKSKK